MALPYAWNATSEECAADYPCDRYLDRPYVSVLRAIDVAAPVHTVYRWLCQLRVAPYSYDWLDNLGRRSPRTLTPGVGELVVGQRFIIFDLVEFEVDRHVTLRTTTARVEAAFGEVSTTYAVRATDGGGTRLVVKLNVRPPRLLGGIRTRLLAWGDLVMMRKQLLTLKECAESSGRIA